MGIRKVPESAAESLGNITIHRGRMKEVRSLILERQREELRKEMEGPESGMVFLIREANGKGATVSEIARALGTTNRAYVYRALSGER